MYALGLKEGKGAIVDRDDSDNDNNVIGQVVRNTADSMPYRLGDVDNNDKERGDDDVQEVVKHSLNSWNPFNSVDAPEGYSFFGKLSFICLGPASEYYSETLSSTGSQVTSVEDKKLMGRAAMLKEVSARATVNRDVGGSDHGMSLATKASFGFMAQNEDDAVQRHHDMRWVTITKMIDTEQKMIDVKMKLADSMVGNGLVCDKLRMSVMKMMDKIEKWNEDLGLMMKELRISNLIVGRVLEHAARPMGLTVVATNPTENLKNDDEDFVAEVLNSDE